MASRSDKVALNIDDEELNSPFNDLVFQEIPHTTSQNSSKSDVDLQKKSQTEQTHVFTNFPTVDDSEADDKSELLEGSSDQKSQPSFLQFKYYQSFFDVDTKQVLARIIGSMYPNIRTNYLHTQIRPKPDYYGPFWICTTLILSIAISGNMANYFASHNSSKYFKWQYDFHKVTMATFVIYTYWLIMPSLIYGFFRWHGNQGNYFFSELVCLYGYSLFIYIPVSVLWLIPLVWLQWTLVLVGMCLSGVVLALNVWPSVREEKKKISALLLAFILLMHGLLAVGFMLYFFSAVSAPMQNNNSNNVLTTLIPGGSTLPNTLSSAAKMNLLNVTSMKSAN